MCRLNKYYIFLLIGIFSGIPYSYSQADTLYYTINFKDASKNIYHVSEIVNWGTAEERIYGVADEYVRASKSLLNTNQEIYFIDPYLNPLKERTYKVLCAMF